MLLTIDVGNTNIVFGVYEGDKLTQCWRVSTNRSKASDEYALVIKQLFKHNGVDIDLIEAVVISSVVPPIMHSLENAIWKCFKLRPLIVNAETKTGLNNLYDNPAQLGSDRLVNAVAAYHLYGGPVIIVDCGTATKFCAVNAEGDYLGGMICPGIKISADALFQQAAMLRSVEFVKPPKVIGKNSAHAVQSGIIFGSADMVDYLVRKMKTEMGAENAKVIATGGLAHLIADETKVIDVVNDNLTLEGLRIIWGMNVAN